MIVNYDTLVLILFNLTLCGACVNRESKENYYEMLLRNDLMQDYFKMEPPNRRDANCSLIEVEIFMIMLQLKFDSDNGVMTIYSKLFSLWKDQRLTWDPIKYENISRTYISQAKIWTPELKFFNAKYYERHDHSTCHLLNNKTALCSEKFLLEFDCNLWVSNWPYDRQNCVLIIGAVTKTPVRLKYHSGSVTLPTYTAQVGGGWDLIDFVRTHNESTNTISIVFVVERRPSNLMSNLIITPCLILTTLTLISLALDMQNSIRMFLLCLNLMWHFFFLTTFGEHIPSKSLDSPSILLYFRSSVIVTTFNIILILILNTIRIKDSEVPLWISNVNEFVYNSPIKIILPFKRRENWYNFAILLNVCVTMGTILVYISLYIAYIPVPYSRFSNINTYSKREQFESSSEPQNSTNRTSIMIL